jgi:hypothetical protein
MASTNLTTYLIIIAVIAVIMGILYAVGVDPSEFLMNLQMMGGRRTRHFGMAGLAAVLVVVILASIFGLGGSVEPFTTTDASGNTVVSGDVSVTGTANVTGQVGLAGDLVHVGSGAYLSGGALAPGATYKAGIVSKGTAWSEGAENSLKGQPPGTFMIAGPQLWKDGNTYKDNVFFVYWNGLDGNQYYGVIPGMSL